MVAGEGGEPASLILALPDGSLRLDSRGPIGSWNSRTGQRESLHLAELQDDSGAEAGLLLARQSARRVDQPPDDEQGQYFLVSDTAGNGLLIMRDSTSPDAPVTAWTWFDETETEWSDVLPPRRIRQVGGPSSFPRPGCWASCAASRRHSWTLPETDPSSTCSGCMRRSSSGASRGR
jgi:hypothetical protein